jgi:ribokinase
LSGNSFQIGFGGKGANKCIVSSRLKSKCAIICKVRLKKGYLKIGFSDLDLVLLFKTSLKVYILEKSEFMKFFLKLGQDIFGKDYLQNLKENNIDTDCVFFTDQAATGVAPIIVDKNG